MSSLTDFLDRFPGQRLLVVGDSMLDRYIWGEAERISPEAPVLVLLEDLDEVRPGGAANVASLLRALEADVVLAGVVGDDAEARMLRRLMDDLTIDTSALFTDSERPTTTKQRFVGRAAQRQPHQILRVDREARTPLSMDLEQRLTDAILAVLPACHAVLISDYNKGVCTPTLLRRVIDAARQHGIPILIDPCRGVDYQRYARATLITPNRAAAALALSSLSTPSSSPSLSPQPSPLSPSHPLSPFLQSAQRLQEHLQLDAAVITLDRDGLAYATATESGLVPCRPREVSDVTGAGDMVLAILGLSLAAQIPIVDSLHLANAAAGLEVERFGVEPLTRAEIAAELARPAVGRISNPAEPSPIKLQSLETLASEAAEHRSAGQRVVLTNGCFDLLHVGHVTLLEEAAREGDILIVAINSDASVRRLKGDTRPIIGQQDRVRMLSALACVDRLLIFDDDTPHRLLQAIRPDVLVKGGTTGHIVGREVVEAYGGRVAWTENIPGLSTTALVQRLQTYACKEFNA